MFIGTRTVIALIATLLATHALAGAMERSNRNPDADANGDDAINATDLGAMRAAFFMPPGPSGLPTPATSGQPCV